MLVRADVFIGLDRLARARCARHDWACSSDVELARETFAPVYEKSAPNGERCGPVCHYSAIQRTID